MSRGGKQFLYGLFYLLVAGFVLFLILAPGLKPVPSCSDNIQNEGETGIDCGGPCIPCYLKGAKSLEVSGTPYVFRIPSLGKALAVVLLVNPNQDIGMHSFSYSVDFVDAGGNVIGTVEGFENIFPAESKYLLAVFDGSPSDVEKIAAADFKVTGAASWSRSSDFLVPVLSITKGPAVSSSTGQVVVSGTVENESVFAVPGVKVIAFLNDKNGNPVFAGGTLVSDLSSFGSSDFSVFLPSGVFSGVDVGSLTPQVFLYAEE